MTSSEVSWKRIVHISSAIVVFLLLVLTAFQLANQDPDESRPIKVRDEDDRWLLPRKFVEVLQKKQEFDSEELSFPKIFSERNLTVTFPPDEEPGIGLAISPGDVGGEIIFSSPNGTELSRVRWNTPPDGMLGGSKLDMPRGFNGGELRMNLTGTGIFVFYNRTLRDDHLLSGNHMEWVSAQSVDTFCLPLISSEDVPLYERLTVSIRSESNSFSARIYDDNFHLLAEVNNEMSAKRQLAMGESTTAFFVIVSDLGETIEVDLRYTRADSASPPLSLILFIEIVVLVLLGARYVRLYHWNEHRRKARKVTTGRSK